MIYLDDKDAKQILLLAPDLLGQSLQKQLSSTEKNQVVSLSKDKLRRHPDLVIWFIESIELSNSIKIELEKLKKRWDPSPILVILPGDLNFTPIELLQFECSGLLQEPNLKLLIESIATVIKGGRVVRLKDNTKNIKLKNNVPLGIGQWLLISGIEQIDYDLKAIQLIVEQSSINSIMSVILLGRKRELLQAKALLNFLWGQKEVVKESLNKINEYSNNSISKYKTNITLEERTSEAIWQQIKSRIETSIGQNISNSTQTIFAIEALKPNLRRKLIKSLLIQLDVVINKLQKSNNIENKAISLWTDLQTELRQNAVKSFIGDYNQIYLNGLNVLINEELIQNIDFTDVDDELPEPIAMIDPIINNNPFHYNGILLPPDDPRAILHLEKLFNNWLIRTSELLASELINSCSKWPELRAYLLNEALISTRELERLRNQLNSQNQIQNIINRPIRLYESKRLFYTLNEGRIELLTITESRDNELRSLGWWQQQIALLIEARDAIAPQIQAIVKYIGDLMVIILTKVIGRAIGLVGKGIAQGMGRTLSKG